MKKPKPILQINFTRLIQDTRLINDYVVHSSIAAAEQQLAFFILSKDIFNIKILKLR